MYYYVPPRNKENQTASNIFKVAAFAFGIAGMIFVFSNAFDDDDVLENQTTTKIAEYAATLPNYNDSIKNAKAPEQIKYYTQKLNETENNIKNYAQHVRGDM